MTVRPNGMNFLRAPKTLTVFIDRVSVPMESIQGVAGQRAILPCNIQPREPNDAVTMVLWFKKDSGDPLYRHI
ncbi:nephrin-like [Vespula squamosa]|uniref:Nephrin-like n=1 Tax=Vespula squamosa TaxID=30214 RepID=A0ABD2A0P3_VESSQ